MFGLLNLDKPAGFTSREAVNRVQRLVQPVKVGHAGTLDPLATGVLIVCLGPATRLASYLHRYPKTYEAEFLLGWRSDTDDVEGKLTPVANALPVNPEQVREVLGRFVGTMEQVPPAYSAVKVDGRRAYALARRGVPIDLQPRQVEIHRLELTGCEDDRVTVTVECSSGTYIRSLARDVGEALGTGGVLSRLRRTRIGPFDVRESLKLDDLCWGVILDRLLPPGLAVGMLPSRSVNPEEEAALRHGRRIAIATNVTSSIEVAIYDASGGLVAVAEEQPGGWLAPRLVFPSGESPTARSD